MKEENKDKSIVKFVNKKWESKMFYISLIDSCDFPKSYTVNLKFLINEISNFQSTWINIKSPYQKFSIHNLTFLINY